MANQSIVPISTIDDLCNWEFINQFDAESDEDGSLYDVQSVDLLESIDSLSSSSDEDDEKEDPTIDSNAQFRGDVECARVSDLGKNQECYNDDSSNFVSSKGDNDLSNLQLNSHDYDVRHLRFANDEGDEEEEEDDDAESDDGYGMDDELVPWEVKDRFVRQRIRKSGKIFGRTARSKKPAFVFTRPGCVRGKHGLGFKVY